MTVDQFVKTRVLPEYQDIVAVLRKLMRERAPKAKEEISYGVPVFIPLAFSRGAAFKDKYGLLEGVGKVSKNVRMSDLGQINKPALRYYIKQALEFDAKR